MSEQVEAAERHIYNIQIAVGDSTWDCPVRRQWWVLIRKQLLLY